MAAGDTLFAQVGLLLHGDGADGGTTITDSSSAPKTPTNTGVATSSTKSLFGGAALHFSAAGNRLVYAHNSAFQPTGDFCIEVAVLLPTTSGATRVIVWKGTSTGPYPYYIYIDGSGYVQANAFGASSLLMSLRSTSTLAANTFNRIAFDRNGDTFRLFVNGSLVASDTASGASYSNASDPLVIGNTSDGGYGVGSGGDAYIDEVRITLASRYTASYTPATEEFPGAFAYSVSGNVKDASGANAARTVRAYREDTGALANSTVSDASTGNYSMSVSVGTAHTVVAYPAFGENLPALVHRGVTPT